MVLGFGEGGGLQGVGRMRWASEPLCSSSSESLSCGDVGAGGDVCRGAGGIAFTFGVSGKVGSGK